MAQNFKSMKYSKGKIFFLLYSQVPNLETPQIEICNRPLIDYVYFFFYTNLLTIVCQTLEMEEFIFF